MPLTALGHINTPINNSIGSTSEPTQQKTEEQKKLHTLVLNIQNTPISIVKDRALSFIKNREGTHHDAGFTRATSFNKSQHGTWLKNPIHLEIKNRTEKSKAIGEEIRSLKSLIKKADHNAKQHCNNNSEHVIGQSVLCQKLSGTKANKEELEVSKLVRSILVNNGLAYQENKRLHENHTGSRWIVEMNNKNEDTAKYNTLDAENGMFFDDKGNVFRVVNGGEGKELSEILAHEKQRVKFGNDISNLLREEYDISSAVQLNQIEYATQHTFRESKADESEKLANDISDYSFYHMINTGEGIYYANEDVPGTIANDKEIILTGVDMDATDKMEMIISRLTVSLGRYPFTSEVKEVINMLDINVPEHLSGLKGEIYASDSETPFFKNLKHS